MPPVVINIRALQICAHNLNRRTTNYAVSFLKKKKKEKSRYVCTNPIMVVVASPRQCPFLDLAFSSLR